MSEQQQRLTAEELREISARCVKVTPGPWETDGMSNVDGPDTGFGELRIATLQNCARRENWANAEFIAASRTDIPRLLAHIAALESFVRSVANPDFSKYDGWEGVVRGKQREAEEVLSE